MCMVCSHAQVLFLFLRAAVLLRKRECALRGRAPISPGDELPAGPAPRFPAGFMLENRDQGAFMISASIALAFAAAFAGAAHLRELGRAAGAARARRRRGAAQRMGAERQSRRRPSRGLCAGGRARRLYHLVRIRRRALGVRRADHHLDLALCVLRHVAAQQPDPVAARPGRRGRKGAHSDMGVRRIRASPPSACSRSRCSSGLSDPEPGFAPPAIRRARSGRCPALLHAAASSRRRGDAVRDEPARLGGAPRRHSGGSRRMRWRWR